MSNHKIWIHTINPLMPKLNPPPSTLVAIRLFKGLTARHIYIYMSFGDKGLNLNVCHIAFKAFGSRSVFGSDNVISLD